MDSSRLPALGHYPRLRRVADYVVANPAEEIDLSTAARIACLSPKYFSRYFKNSTGIGFHDWLARVRIELAKEEFRDLEQSITTIAGKVGYKEIGTFERQFKKLEGVTPREYRHQLARSVANLDNR